MKLSDAHSKKTQIAVLLLNAALFQVVWLLNVMELNPYGFMTAAGAVAVHFALVAYLYGSRACRREGAWLVTVAIVGCLVEFFFSSVGLLVHDFRSDSLLGIPVWLVLLWVAFATTFRFSLTFLRGKSVLAAAMGLSAVLSYWGGAALNGTSAIGEPLWWSLTLIALTWACALPVLVKIHQSHVL